LRTSWSAAPQIVKKPTRLHETLGLSYFKVLAGI
jgi:hypothetical protein